METFSALLALCAGISPVPGEFPTQRPVTRSFDVFSDLRPNKRLSKQSWDWWFETQSCPLWCHCNDHWPMHYYVWLRLGLSRLSRCLIFKSIHLDWYENRLPVCAHSNNLEWFDTGGGNPISSPSRMWQQSFTQRTREWRMYTWIGK